MLVVPQPGSKQSIDPSKKTGFSVDGVLFGSVG